MQKLFKSFIDLKYGNFQEFKMEQFEQKAEEFNIEKIMVKELPISFENILDFLIQKDIESFNECCKRLDISNTKEILLIWETYKDKITNRKLDLDEMTSSEWRILLNNCSNIKSSTLNQSTNIQIAINLSKKAGKTNNSLYFEGSFEDMKQIDNEFSQIEMAIDKLLS